MPDSREGDEPKDGEDASLLAAPITETTMSFRNRVVQNLELRPGWWGWQSPAELPH